MITDHSVLDLLQIFHFLIKFSNVISQEILAQIKNKTQVVKRIKRLFMSLDFFCHLRFLRE